MYSQYHEGLNDSRVKWFGSRLISEPGTASASYSFCVTYCTVKPSMKGILSIGSDPILDLSVNNTVDRV